MAANKRTTIAANQRNVNDEIDRLVNVDINTSVNQVFGYFDQYPSLREVKKRYRQMTLQIHPDRGGSANDRAKDAFQVLSRAWELAMKSAEYAAYAPDSALSHLEDHFVEETLLFSQEPLDFEEELEQMHDANQDDDDDPTENTLYETFDINAFCAQHGLNEALDEEAPAPVPATEEAPAASPAPAPDVNMTGDDGGDDIDAEAQIMIALRKRKAAKKEADRKNKKKVKLECQAEIKAERTAAATWRPDPVPDEPTELVEGTKFETRWESHKHVRSVFNSHGPQFGVKVHQKIDELTATCGNPAKGDDKCGAFAKFARRQKDKQWHLIKFCNTHRADCAGAAVDDENDDGSDVAYAKPCYTPLQVANCIATTDRIPTMNAKSVKEIVDNQRIFRRAPATRFYRTVANVIKGLKEVDRAVEMAALPGLIELYRGKGHVVEFYDVTGAEMKKIRIAAAKHIFEQLQKAGEIPKDDVFDEESVETADIDLNKKYYGGITIQPSYAVEMLQRLRKTTGADAAHCLGLGKMASTSYGTIAHLIAYDTIFNIIPIIFMHKAGNEDKLMWKQVFRLAAGIVGFNEDGSVCMVDMEKGISGALEEESSKTTPFYDQHHVIKNMNKEVGGTEKPNASRLYKLALYAGSEAQVTALKAEFGPKQKEYLGKFKDAQLYSACAGLKDSIYSSQGPESQNGADLKNKIRNVEPTKMVHLKMEKIKQTFDENKRAAERHDKPVPPRVEKRLAQIIKKGKLYLPSLRWESNEKKVCTVASFGNTSTNRRRVVFKGFGNAPDCCAYAGKDGLPCYHGMAAIIDKHGESQAWKFLAEYHLTTWWQEQYRDVEMELPSQADVDAVYAQAKALVLAGENLEIPKALNPPRGRPCKDAGKRKKNYYEQGPGGARATRTYTCSLCGLPGHTRRNCVLAQTFDGTSNSTTSDATANNATANDTSGGGPTNDDTSS